MTPDPSRPRQSALRRSRDALKLSLTIVRRTAAQRVGWLFWLLDVVVPTRPGVVVRTSTTFDDQALEFVAAFSADNPAGVPLTWLVSGRTALPPRAAGIGGVRVVSAGSAAGIWAYLRANTVVHTHGVMFGSERLSRRKKFVNLWHGMPVKKVSAVSRAGRLQTDETIVTSEFHVPSFVQTWSLRQDQVQVTGLPRNDVLVRGAGQERPSVRGIPDDRRLVMWLPTWRASWTAKALHTGEPLRVDGVEYGNPFQFPGATPEAVNDVFAQLDMFCLLKTHPMTPLGKPMELSHLAVWPESALLESGQTLYEVLAASDILITDYSSVWLDFVLVDRPIVFTVADLAEYVDSRGTYFEDLPNMLPGPQVRSLDELAVALRESAAEPGAWQDQRHEAARLHHRFHDDRSGARVAQLVNSVVARD